MLPMLPNDINSLMLVNCCSEEKVDHGSDDTSLRCSFTAKVSSSGFVGMKIGQNGRISSSILQNLTTLIPRILFLYLSLFLFLSFFSLSFFLSLSLCFSQHVSSSFSFQYLSTLLNRMNPIQCLLQDDICVQMFCIMKNLLENWRTQAYWIADRCLFLKEKA